MKHYDIILKPFRREWGCFDAFWKHSRMICKSFRKAWKVLQMVRKSFYKAWKTYSETEAGYQTIK